MEYNIRSGPKGSMANLKVYKRPSFLTFFIFAKARPVRTKVTDIQTDRHTQKLTSP